LSRFDKRGAAYRRAQFVLAYCFGGVPGVVGPVFERLAGAVVVPLLLFRLGPLRS